jgi:hypothetical protein
VEFSPATADRACQGLSRISRATCVGGARTNRPLLQPLKIIGNLPLTAIKQRASTLNFFSELRRRRRQCGSRADARRSLSRSSTEDAGGLCETGISLIRNYAEE